MPIGPEEQSVRQAKPAELPEILTAKDLEAFLRIDVKTIYGYVQRGLIPYIRIQSNLRFRKQDVLDWISRQSYPLHTHGGGNGNNCRK